MDFLFEVVRLLTGVWSLLGDVAPEAVVKALIVFVAVLGLRLAKVLPTSKWARAANLVLSAMLAGVTQGGANPQEALLFTMTAGLAATVWDLLSALYEKKFNVDKAIPDKE